MTLVTHMVSLANKNSYLIPPGTEGGWMARPTSVHLRQTNDYDCGVWVLAGIAAVLQGFHVTGCSETDISFIQQYIANLACSLPVV